MSARRIGEAIMEGCAIILLNVAAFTGERGRVDIAVALILLLILWRLREIHA